MGLPIDHSETQSADAAEQFSSDSKLQTETDHDSLLDIGQQPAEIQHDSLEDSLRRLRSRQLMMEAVYDSAAGSGIFYASPSQNDEAANGDETTSDDSHDDSEELEIEFTDEESPELDFDFEAAFDDLRQEIRRLGRELFKTNRTAESNQESFGEALAEIRQLSTVVAQVPAQAAESVAEARFEAKAALCRDLLRLADSAELGLTAADELVARLEKQSLQPAIGLVFRFQQVRQLREALAESVAAIRQWRDGQRLMVERVQAILTAAGVRPMETLGRGFDPSFHRAVSAEVRREVSPGTIVGEELKGYTLEGRILRYAEVIVAKHE